ncbi:hypothetical protein Bca4012_047725 [Brassica carinata]
MEIERYKATRVEEEDISLWKNKNGDYKKCFSSRDTWEVIREKHMSCYWYKAVWYKYATPKFSFILWTALNGKLSTGDRMIKWSGSTDTACVLCRNHPLETLQHLFFDCSFSTQVWEKLMKGVLGNIFTSNWGSILRIALDQSHRKIRLFVIRYVLQSAVLWTALNGKLSYYGQLFILWTALNGKLSTGDRMIKWSGSTDTACVLCRNHPLETLQHLFFDCSFSTQVWEKLMKGVLGNIFTSNWGSILRIALDQSHRKIRLFVIRYVLQYELEVGWVLMRSSRSECWNPVGVNAGYLVGVRAR